MNGKEEVGAASLRSGSSSAQPSAVQHTRGPWRANGCEIIGDSRVVATVHWCSGFDVEDAGNRALIAAAPDLLAACLKVNRCGNGGARLSREASDAVRAAIALATKGA